MGIACPELSQDFGTRAKQFTSTLVFGNDVLIEEYSPDRYGRMVARVSVGSEDLSLQIVRADHGGAPFPPVGFLPAHMISYLAEKANKLAIQHAPLFA
jgi:endonuclease YncB( thermonuclease family)